MRTEVIPTERTLTTLGRGREEAHLDLLLAELIRKLDDRVPRSLAHRLAVDVDVVDKVDLATGVDCDLVAGADGQTRVVARAEVHDTLARSRVGLLINRAGNGELVLRRARVERLTSGELGRVIVDRGSLRTRRYVRASRGGDTVPDVRTCDRVGVVRLDVEYLRWRLDPLSVHL